MIERRFVFGVPTLSIALTLFAAITIPSTACAADIFSWTDENGTVHFSDSVSDVPAKYRKSIKQKKFGPDTDSPSATLNTPVQPPDQAAVPSPEPTPKDENAAARFEVPYTPYEGSARRLIVSVRFNNRVTAPMILDTGAPSSLISMDIAEELGLLDKEHGRLLVNIGGIGGSAVAVKTILDRVQIGDAKIDFVPAEIASSISDKFEGLIGMDFMANYSTQIDSRKHVVVFEQIEDDANRPGGYDETWWRNTFREFADSYNRWKDYLQRLDKEIEQSPVVNRGMSTDLSRRRDFAYWQTHEAEKLMDRLHRFARENAVPMHWRTY